MKKIIIFLTIFISLLILGWFILPEWSEEYYVNGETHAWGLKFLYPCIPFGYNATCGWDLLFTISIGWGVIWAVSPHFPKEEKC